MANIKISELAPAEPLDGSELIEVSQLVEGVLESRATTASALSGVGTYAIVTEPSAFTAAPGTHDGLARYVRAGGDVTFDSAEPYVSGMVFNIRATASIQLVESGISLAPTYGGTLALEGGMGVQVVFTSGAAAEVNGLTVSAP